MKQWLRGALLTLLLALPVAHAAAQATPVPDDGQGTLIVADPAAHALYAYGLPDLELEASLDGVEMNTHAGFLPLPDGRLLLIDDAADELLAVRHEADTLEMCIRDRPYRLWNGSTDGCTQATPRCQGEWQ